MDAQLVGTLTCGGLRAQIYSSRLPGEFKVVYQDTAGNTLEEIPLTGISTYKQRESEIMDRLRQLSKGAKVRTNPDLRDPGEY